MVYKLVLWQTWVSGSASMRAEEQAWGRAGSWWGGREAGLLSWVVGDGLEF